MFRAWGPRLGEAGLQDDVPGGGGGLAYGFFSARPWAWGVWRRPEGSGDRSFFGPRRRTGISTSCIFCATGRSLGCLWIGRQASAAN